MFVLPSLCETAGLLLMSGCSWLLPFTGNVTLQLVDSTEHVNEDARNCMLSQLRMCPLLFI